MDTNNLFGVYCPYWLVVEGGNGEFRTIIIKEKDSAERLRKGDKIIVRHIFEKDGVLDDFISFLTMGPTVKAMGFENHVLCVNAFETFLADVVKDVVKTNDGLPFIFLNPKILSDEGKEFYIPFMKLREKISEVEEGVYRKYYTDTLSMIAEAI